MASRIQATIAKQGKLASPRSTYVRRNVALFGSRRVVPAARTIAARLAKPGTAQPKSTQVVMGEAPDGFGKQILWDPNDAGLAVVVFLNAGDPYGVMISGVRRTDAIEFVSATGIASFAEDTENKGVGAFIGIVGAGATLTASAFGAPELAPFIGKATELSSSGAADFLQWQQ